MHARCNVQVATQLRWRPQDSRLACCRPHFILLPPLVMMGHGNGDGNEHLLTCDTRHTSGPAGVREKTPVISVSVSLAPSRRDRCEPLWSRSASTPQGRSPFPSRSLPLPPACQATAHCLVRLVAVKVHTSRQSRHFLRNLSSVRSCRVGESEFFVASPSFGASF